MGKFVFARKHFEQSLALYDPEKHHVHANTYGQDPGVALLSHGALILWHLGYPDQAVKRAEEALAHARHWPHPFSHEFALCYGAILFQYCRDVKKTRERNNEAIVLANEQGFPLWLAHTTVMHGWLLLEQGEKEKSLSEIQKGLADMISGGSEMWRSRDLTFLAEAYLKAGQIDKGLKALDESLSLIESTDGRHYAAEINRLKGQFLLRQGTDDSEGESYFHRAIDIAKKQSARSLELRATMSLSRLLQKQGKNDEALELLSEIYNWFTEGFETADLKDAKSLLDNLT